MALVLNCWEEANSANAAVSSLDVNKPTSSSTLGDSPKNAAVGDILIIIVGNDDNSDVAQWDDATLKPTGFTLINEAGESTRDCHCAAFYRVVDGTEGSSFTIPAQSADDMWAACILVSNNESSTPIHQTGADSAQSTAASGTPLSIAQVTTTINYCLGIAIAAYDGGDDGGFTVGGIGWGEKSEIRDGTAAANASGVWATKVITAAGGSVACTVYPAVSDGMVGFQFAIPPKANWTLAAASGKVDINGVAATEYTVIIVEEYVGAGKVDIGGSTQRWAYKQYKNIFTHGFFENNYFDDELPTARQVFTAGWLPTEQAYSQSYTGSGLITISGVATFVVTKDFVQAPSGKVTISGISTCTSTKDYTASVSGKIQISGATQTSELNDYVSTVSGKVEINGLGITQYTKIFVTQSLGQVNISGISSFEFTRVYSKEAAGKVDLTGVALTSFSTELAIIGSGEVVFSGTAQKEYNVIHSYAALGQVIFNGSSLTSFERIFVTTCSGKVDVNGAATTLTTIEYTTSAVGKIQISGAVLTSYTRSFTTSSAGKIDISGVVTSLIGEKHFVITSLGKIDLSGVAATQCTKIFVTSCIGEIALGGAASTTSLFEAIYISSGKIDIKGSSVALVGTKHFVSLCLGEIELRGSSSLEYSKNYVFSLVSGEVQLFGNASCNIFTVYSYSSIGKVELIGVCIPSFTFDYFSYPEGVINVFGSSDKTIEFARSGIGKINFSGVVDLSCVKHFVYNVFGEIEVLGEADIWISNQFEYLSSGELVFLGSPKLLCAVLSRMEIVEWETQVTKVKSWKTRVLLEKEIDTPLYDLAYSR